MYNGREGKGDIGGRRRNPRFSYHDIVISVVRTNHRLISAQWQIFEECHYCSLYQDYVSSMIQSGTAPSNLGSALTFPETEHAPKGYFFPFMEAVIKSAFHQKVLQRPPLTRQRVHNSMRTEHRRKIDMFYTTEWGFFTERYLASTPSLVTYELGQPRNGFMLSR